MPMPKATNAIAQNQPSERRLSTAISEAIPIVAWPAATSPAPPMRHTTAIAGYPKPSATCSPFVISVPTALAASMADQNAHGRNRSPRS